MSELVERLGLLSRQLLEAADEIERLRRMVRVSTSRESGKGKNVVKRSCEDVTIELSWPIDRLSWEGSTKLQREKVRVLLDSAIDVIVDAVNNG